MLASLDHSRTSRTALFVVNLNGMSPDYKCYTKATIVGWGSSEGGTHEETLCPQEWERDYEEIKDD